MSKQIDLNRSFQLDRRSVLKGAAGLGLTSVLTSFGLQNAKAADLTREEIAAATGPLNFIGAQPYEVRETWPADLAINWAYNTSNEDIIVKTTQAGTFDALIIYQGMIDQLIKLDRIEPIDVSLLSNWDAMAPMFRDADVIRRDGKVYAIPFQWGYGYLQYNADHTKEPKTFEDLLDPKLARKIGLPDDPYAVITTFAIFAGAAKANNLTREEFDKAIKLLRDFKSQVLTIHAAGDEIGLLARGDIWVDFPAYSNSLTLSREAGAKNLQYTKLAAWSYIDCFMVVKDAVNKAAAYKFINEGLSTATQSAVTAHSLAFPVNDAAIPSVAPEMRYSSAADALATAPMMPGVTVETTGPDVPFQEWMTAWNEFKAL